MATVYEHRDGIYNRRNEWEVDGLSIDDAIESIIGSRGNWSIDDEYRIARNGLVGYGGDAVLVERMMIDEDGRWTDEYEPYLIIGEER